MNKSTIRFLCSNLIKDEILATALTFWLAFLHSPSTCSSKVSLLSIFIPKNFPLHVLENFLLQISAWWIFLSLRRRWNLSGFIFIQLFWNHKVSHSATLWTTTHCKWNAVICINYLVDIWLKEEEITKKDIKNWWTQYEALSYTMYYICPFAKRLIYFYL